MFDQIYPYDLTAIMYSIANSMEYWSIMQRTGVRPGLRNAARRLAKVATEIFHKRAGWGPLTKRIDAG